MNKVNFKYRPVQWLPFKKEIKTTHPEKWEELTQLQFEEVVKFKNLGEILNKDIIHLTNILLSLNKPLFDFPEEVYKLAKFINSPDFISCWIIPSIKTKHHTYYGPLNKFKDVSILQFAFADTFFIQYVREKKVEYLDKLITTLYTLEEFNPDKMNRLDDLAGIPPETKAAILYNYINVRMWIMEKYPYVFPKQSEESTLRQAQGDQKRKPHSSWREYLRNLVNGDYVNEEKILNINMHTILYDHNENLKQQKNRKK